MIRATGHPSAGPESGSTPGHTLASVPAGCLFRRGRRRGGPGAALRVEAVLWTLALACAVIVGAVVLDRSVFQPRAGSALAALAPLIDNGASPRASIALIKVAKAHALLNARDYISPHDIKTIAHDVLRHRILVSYEAEAQGKTTDHVIAQILENIPVP